MVLRSFTALTFILDRKLEPDECPHEVYINNYTNGELTRIVMKRWLFNTKLESQLCRDETALNFIFWEVSDSEVYCHIAILLFQAIKYVF